MEGGTRVSAIGVGGMWLCLRVFGLRSEPISRLGLDSGITNPTSLRNSFARELQTKPKQDLGQIIYTHTAQPARFPGELTNASSFEVNLLCSLYYWGVST
jgi:hypothetical protein